MKINKKSVLFTMLLFLFISISVGLTYGKEKEGDKGKSLNKVTNKSGDSYRMWINNINFPLNRSGVLADVSIATNGLPSALQKGAVYDNQIFLFSGGFYLSGIDNAGRKWTNAVASASRIQDYTTGPYGKSNDPKAQLYVVSSGDAAFSQSWQDWKDAVAMGAHFYDGDGDGIYNPVDKNGNGKWDADEDRPDLIGDETVWCVYNDDVPPAQRTFNDVAPQGIEIKQTVFAFKSKSVTGNIIFVRYEIENKGKQNELDSTYFTVWADPDLGNSKDDLVGCDTLLNAGFIYNNGADAVYGANPPCFLIDFFQGPASYTGVATDTAYEVNGKYRGINKIAGYKNLGLSSFTHYLNGDIDIGDPASQEDARNYQHGLNKAGKQIDPCNWSKGTVKGVDCKLVNNKFWYSGDPVIGQGWINKDPADQRIMLNTGPFKLAKGQPVAIVVAYVVGRGADALNSITVAKDIDKKAQQIFDNNFPSPPPPPSIDYSVKSSPNYLDINMATDTTLKYRAIDRVQLVDRDVQGFYVTQYRTSTRSATVAGQLNSKVIATYSKNNYFKSLKSMNATGGFDKVFERADGNLLDSALYANSNTGRLKLRLTQDAFAGSSFIKGKIYYFTMTSFTINHDGLYAHLVPNSSNVMVSDSTFIDSSGAAYEEFESQIIPVVFNEDEYNPALDIAKIDNGGKLKYIVPDPKLLTGDNYQVNFYRDSTQFTSTYKPYWKLTNLTTNKVLLDSMKLYNTDSTDYSGIVTEGFQLRIQNALANIGTSQTIYSDSTNLWYKAFRDTSGTGVHYVGQDIPQGSVVQITKGSSNINGSRSNAISADRLRKVELRFGSPNAGKAYRYVNGYKGTAILKVNSWTYAPYITAADTVGKGAIGMLGQGFVDVPFTAWVKDARNGEEKQLAVGFTEMSPKIVTSKGNPDGIYNPGDSLLASGETIIIFDAPYDPTGKQVEYTGEGLTLVNPANGFDLIKGNNVAASDTKTTPAQKRIANSPWFNALYVVGLEKKNVTSQWKEGDILTIPVTAYPYTELDKYTFSTARYENSAQAKKDLFNKITVFPNPLFAYNPATSYTNGNTDEPFVTFSNLPTEVTIKVYTLSGTLVRTLHTSNKSVPTSPFLRWNLQNENGLRVASGMYLATIDCPGFGQKVLKFAVIMPQKQIQKY